MDRWVVADTHFCHDKIILYCSRPFVSSEEMDERMVANWNNLVKPSDEVYHLGDFACGPKATDDRVRGIFNSLNGKKFLIEGNHDTTPKGELKDRLKGLPFEWHRKYFVLRHNGTDVHMFHWPMRTWEEATHGSIHLFGHVHGKYRGVGRSMDVGVDVQNFTPVNLDAVIARLKQVPIEQEI